MQNQKKQIAQKSQKKANKQMPLENLTKEQWLEKCKNQRAVICQLRDAGRFLMKKVNLLELAISSKPLNYKLNIYMQETLSYMDDVEQLKQQIKKLEKGE